MRHSRCVGLSDGGFSLQCRDLPCTDVARSRQPGRPPPPCHRMGSNTGMDAARFGRHPCWHSPPAKHERVRSKRARSPACSSSSAVQPAYGYRVRRAVAADVPAIAELLKQTFARDAASGVLPLAAQLFQLQGCTPERMQRDMAHQMQTSLRMKGEAARQAREFHNWRRLKTLEAEIAAMKAGQRFGAFSLPLQTLEKQQLKSWTRLRKYALLLAEDVKTRQLLGATMCCLLAAEALLPPPFPSTAPVRYYIGNVTVAPEARRRGVATSLLQRSELLGRRWGYDSVWLHRDVENEAAERLYAKLGYQTQRSTSGFASFTDRRVLLTKQLQPWRLNQRTQTDMAVPGTQGPDGVFMWQESLSDPS